MTRTAPACLERRGSGVNAVAGQARVSANGVVELPQGRTDGRALALRARGRREDNGLPEALAAAVARVEHADDKRGKHARRVAAVLHDEILHISRPRHDDAVDAGRGLVALARAHKVPLHGCADALHKLVLGLVAQALEAMRRLPAAPRAPLGHAVNGSMYQALRPGNGGHKSILPVAHDKAVARRGGDHGLEHLRMESPVAQIERVPDSAGREHGR